MTKIIWIAVLGVLAISGAQPAMSACMQGADPSAPLIGASGMRAIDRIAVKLPKLSPKIALNVGGVVPRSAKLTPIPREVVAVLAQYARYNVARSARTLVIVDPASRAIAYLLPLGQGPAVVCP